MSKDTPMVVAILDPSTSKIVGIIGANDTDSYSENCVRVTDPASVSTISAHFAKEPNPYNYQNDLFYSNGQVSSKPNIELIKYIKINELYNACTMACSGGFTSSALGAPHEYPSKEIDQHNIHAAVLASLAQPSGWSTHIWCAAGDAWNMVPHTTIQVQQILKDMVTYIDTNRTALKQLIDQINTISNDPSSENAKQIRLVQWNKI